MHTYKRCHDTCSCINLIRPLSPLLHYFVSLLSYSCQDKPIENSATLLAAALASKRRKKEIGQYIAKRALPWHVGRERRTKPGKKLYIKSRNPPGRGRSCMNKCRLKDLELGGRRSNIVLAQGVSGSFFTLVLRQLAQGETHAHTPKSPIQPLLLHRRHSAQ